MQTPAVARDDFSSLRSLELRPILRCLLLLLVSHLPVSAIRREIGFGETMACQNTHQGQHLISDDNGYVCTPFSLNTWSQCCPETGERFSCRGCKTASQCCDSYSYCVSCCLDPSRTKEEIAVKTKVSKPATAGYYASVFDFCAGRCRHSSASVVHENAYASEFHHCYSMPQNSTGLKEFSSDGKLAGVNLLIGRQGESCQSVCMSKGRSCLSSMLIEVNRCQLLQKHLGCKRGCFVSLGALQPAEVVSSAPHYLNPGACMYTQMEGMLTCDGAHQFTRRLCPCT